MAAERRGEWPSLQLDRIVYFQPQIVIRHPHLIIGDKSCEEGNNLCNGRDLIIAQGNNSASTGSCENGNDLCNGRDMTIGLDSCDDGNNNCNGNRNTFGECVCDNGDDMCNGNNLNII